MGGGPPGFRPGFPCPALLGNTAGRENCAFAYGAITLYGPSFQTVPLARPFVTLRTAPHSRPRRSRDPGRTTHAGLTCVRFRLVPVRSPLLGESRLLSSPGATKMVQFAPFALTGLCIQPGVTQHYPCRVAPFGNLRIDGCLHLPEAYRSLPRPSSPLRAKASTMRP